MRTTLAALSAALLLANAAPASACGYYGCYAVGDDSYPPGEIPLPPAVQMEVIARQGKGLSLAGFYNDPSLALAYAYYARPRGPVLRRSY
jgi:hypothetical protein